MKINEVFQTNYDWKFEGNTGYIYADFYTDSGIRYQVSFAGVYCISIQFHSIGENGSTQSITGTGDAFKIFSTIKNIIVSFVKNKKPESFTFAAKKSHPSRIKLYKRLSNELIKIVPYKVVIDDEDGQSEILFTFNRNYFKSIKETTINELVNVGEYSFDSSAYWIRPDGELVDAEFMAHACAFIDWAENNDRNLYRYLRSNFNLNREHPINNYAKSIGWIRFVIDSLNNKMKYVASFGYNDITPQTAKTGVDLLRKYRKCQPMTVEFLQNTNPPIILSYREALEKLQNV